MADFSTRTDPVNVEQIMEQIRSRIREKRGVDYEAQQINELAKAKLEKLLDPRSVQTDLLDRLKKLQPSYEPPQLPAYEFEDSTLYESTRGPLRFIRTLLNPILKLFFNPNPLIGALHTQSKLNAMYAEREAKRDAMRLAGEQLYYQLLHNLLIEITQAGIEIKSLRMRVESIGSRLEFNERRARALESAAFAAAVQSVPERPSRQQPPQQQPPAPLQQIASPQTPSAAPAAVPGSPQSADGSGQGQGQRSRRRRRRRGRRGGGQQPGMPGAPAQPALAGGEAAADVDDEENGSEDAAPARDDLDNFGGAAAHPSESEVEPAPEPAAEPPAPAPTPPGHDDQQ